MGNLPKYNTLFLDRDGVINRHRPDDYVKSIEEFVFADGALDALRLLSPLFRYIIIVTNQRGVGRGVMLREKLDEIHKYMLDEVTAHNGRIDRIYVCTDINDECPDRKPNTGMGLQAKKDFPDIVFSESIMAGDSISDIQFANRLGVPAVLIGGKIMSKTFAALQICGHYPDLLTFAQTISQSLKA